MEPEYNVGFNGPSYTSLRRFLRCQKLMLSLMKQCAGSDEDRQQSLLLDPVQLHLLQMISDTVCPLLNGGKMGQATFPCLPFQYGGLLGLESPPDRVAALESLRRKVALYLGLGGIIPL